MPKRILMLVAAVLSILLVLSAFNLFPFDQQTLTAPPVSARAESAAVNPPAALSAAPAKAVVVNQNPNKALLPASKDAPLTVLPSPTAVSVDLLSGWRLYLPQVIKQDGMFLVQPGTPAYVQNFAHPAQGCKWLSVAGQVMEAAGGSPFGGQDGQPVSGLVVSVLGLLNGNVVNELTLTGLAPDYGPGGFEVQLAGEPVASSGALWVQIYNLDGQAVTEPVFFNTKADCSQNVVLVNFKR